jgi:putative Mn2+ efflux pump MntP
MTEFITLFLIGVGLSMDAFAVSICKGLGMEKVNKKQAVIIGLYFGGFQALMPLIGWLLGIRFQKYITSVDHWIAFILLVLIGGKMVFEALHEKEEVSVDQKDLPLNHKEMLLLAIATSIDALAVGITLALLPGTNIWFSIAVIGITTFIISFSGVFIGNRFGAKYQRGAQIAGGVILIIIGLKILLEGLGIL